MPPADPLREKLKALVEEMLSDRISVAAGNAAYKALTGQECWSGVTRVNVTDMWAAKITALLAESEPEPCSAAACTSTEHHSTDCPARRPDCEAKAKPRMDPAYPPANIAAEIRREEMALPEAKAKLPLGHTFQDYGYSRAVFCAWCGQPRSAHELDKGEGGTP